jgi:FAD/FMN-containing dehydrogenase
MLSTPDFTRDVEGQVVTPRDPGYDEARRVFMAGVDRRPALVVRAAGTADVARAIAYARDSGLELAVRAGGHSPAGHGTTDGGIVLDLGALRELTIDAGARTAWAGAGVTAAEYTAAAGAHGLATGFGDMGSVGVAGITLAGGVGFLVRKHGLTADQLLAAELVTADGELIQADADTHPDLFWALRGGGGNFGVVTRLRYRLHEVGTILGGMLFLPATPDVVAGVLAEAEAAPDELSVIVNVMKAPPLPFVPPEAHGRMVVMVILAYAGDVAAGERAVAPIRALAEPVADLVRPMAYPEMYPPEDPDYRPLAVGRTGFADGVDRAMAAAILERIEASPVPRVAQLRPLGGALARVPADATAFAHRDRRLMFNAAAFYQRPEEQAEAAAWAASLAGELSGGDPAGYVGFLYDEGEERVRAAYPGPTWERLRAVKAQYDPENVFRLNQNVPPAP